MMGKFEQTKELMWSSWGILKQDKELIIFPALSVIVTVVIMASFILPVFLFVGPDTTPVSGDLQQQSRHGAGFGFFIALLFYFVTYTVVVFFNAATVACVAKRFDGGDPTVKYGLQEAWKRRGLILKWSLLAALVGAILNAAERRSNLLGKIVVGMIGIAWSLATYLVVPILVLENKGPVESLKESARLLKNTWGEQIIGNMGFGLIFMVLNIPFFICLALAIISAPSVAMIFFIILGLLYTLCLAMLHVVLRSIFQVALYRFVREGAPPSGFENSHIDEVVVVKPNKYFTGG